jgi:YidC/Oxa1 family membrane protein insertase
MKPELEALTARIKANPDVGYDDREKQSRQMKQLFEKYRCHPLRSLMMMPLAQMPIFISMFLGLKVMNDHFPSLAEGGTLWFTGLSVADPTYGLPVVTAFSFFLLIIEVGADGQDTAQMGQFKNVMRVLALTMVPMTYWLPNCVFMYWMSSNAFSLGQTLAFKVISYCKTKLFAVE